MKKRIQYIAAALLLCATFGTFGACRKGVVIPDPDPAPMPEPEARLSGTYDLGASTLNEGEVINASRWGVVYAHVQGGKMTHLRPFEFDYAPSPNLISAIFRTRRLASVSRWFAKAGSRTARRAVAAAAKRSSCPSPGKRHSTSWQAK